MLPFLWPYHGYYVAILMLFLVHKNITFLAFCVPWFLHFDFADFYHLL